MRQLAEAGLSAYSVANALALTVKTTHKARQGVRMIAWARRIGKLQWMIWQVTMTALDRVARK